MFKQNKTCVAFFIFIFWIVFLFRIRGCNQNQSDGKDLSGRDNNSINHVVNYLYYK